MAEGILTLDPMMPVKERNQQRLNRLIDPALGAGIGLALANMFKNKNKENLPEEVDKEKTPQQEPPEGEPDLLPELSKQTVEEVIRKEIKEKQPEDPDFIPEVLTLKEIDEDDNPDLDTPEAFNEEGKIVDTDKLVKKEIDGVPFYDVPFVKRIETERHDAFPFSIKDFKGGALDNKIIKEAFEYVGGDEPNPPQPFDESAFLVTPSRGQQEIALRLIKQKLIEDEASPKIIKHITNLQNELKDRIKKTGYFGRGAKLEENLDVGFGLFNQLKRKKNAKGGMIDSPLPGRSRYI